MSSKSVFIICGVLFLLFVPIDIAFIGCDILTYLAFLIVCVILLIVALRHTITSLRHFSLKNVPPLIAVILTPIAMFAVLCLTPSTIPSHNIENYFFSKQLYDIPLPDHSKLILKAGTHGNSTGSGNHCKSMSYIAITSDREIEYIHKYYESMPANKNDKEEFAVYLFDKNKDDTPIGIFRMYDFTEEQKKELIDASERNEGKIYLVSIARWHSTTCLAGH